MGSDPTKLRTVKGCDKVLVELRRQWKIAGTDGDKAILMCRIDRVLERRVEIADLAALESRALVRA